MKRIIAGVVLGSSLSMLGVVTAQADPNRWLIERAAVNAGCAANMPERRIIKISESGGYPVMYAYRVDCRNVPRRSYVIVVCEGEMSCAVRD